MKYLLILFLSFFSVSAFSQGIYNKAATNIKQNRLMVDSVLGVPRDTSATNNATFNGAPVGDSGRIAYQFGKFWGHDGSGWNLLGSGSADLSNYYTIPETDTLFLKKGIGYVYPYDSAYKVYPIGSHPNAAPFDIVNIADAITAPNPFFYSPSGIVKNAWTISMVNNIQFDSTGGWHIKVFNPSYPAAYTEHGWEGIGFHVIPSGVPIVNTYPHETFQVRTGIDGTPLYDLNKTYNQIKSTLVARWDTSFNMQDTEYGWWSQDKRPFLHFFSEKAMTNGNKYADFAQYMTAATSGAKLDFSRSRGTYSAMAAVQNNDTLGNIMFNAYDGASMLPVGRLYGRSTGNATVNNAPSALTLMASNGASNVGTATINSDGNFGVGTVNPGALMHLVRDGFGGLLLIDRYTNGLGNLPPSIYGFAANGTSSAPTGILKGERLITVNGSAHDGVTADRNSVGSIAITADTTFTPTAKSTRFDVFTTKTVGDTRSVFSINKFGQAVFGEDGEADAVARMTIYGSVKADAPNYTTGGYRLLTRNITTGLFESVPSTTYAPSAPNGYVELSPLSRQLGRIDINTSSSLVSTGNATWSIGQTTSTPTNLAGIQIDGVDGNFIGSDYLSIIQLQSGTASIRNFNSANNLILGSGSSTSTNLTLKPNNLSAFGGGVEYPITTLSATSTLNAGQYTINVNNSANITLNLPAASTCSGRIYIIKKISNNAFTVSVDPNASENIEGTSTPYSITTYLQSITIQSDGTAWWIY